MTTLKLQRHQMISSTEMARRFSEYLERTRKAEHLFVIRNNEIEAVLMGIEEYERLTELEALAEHLEIAKLIESRRKEPEGTDLEALLHEEDLDPSELRQSDPT